MHEVHNMSTQTVHTLESNATNLTFGTILRIILKFDATISVNYHKFI